MRLVSLPPAVTSVAVSVSRNCTAVTWPLCPSSSRASARTWLAGHRYSRT